MTGDTFEAGKAIVEPDTSVMQHDAVAKPVWTALEATIGAMSQTSPGEQLLSQLLRGMRETHGSMRAVRDGAVAAEQSQQQSGRWTDMLVLARAQYDAVFNGLLIADDGTRWAPAYKKAGWKTMAQRHFYELRRFENTSAGKTLKATNVPRLQRLAAWAGVTAEEWSATEAEVEGKPLPRGAKNIRNFPTPADALKELKDPSFKELGRLLYPLWKFLCDAAHAGLSTLLLRALMRDAPQGTVPTGARDDFIYEHAVGSIRYSLVAAITLVTVASLSHRSDADLRAKIVTAWGPLERGTLEGSVIWYHWAHRMLGLLDASA